MFGYILMGIFIVALVIVIANIAIVPQATSYVVERLGIYYKTWDAGFHWRFPSSTA